MRTHNRQHTNPESGVTLLLSLLILGAITAIAYSLAAIMLVEIRNSADLQRTEPALFATQGILEEAIFKLKRNISDTVMPITGSCSTPVALNCSINGVKMTTEFSPREETPLNDTILPSSSNYVNTKFIYYLLNPDDPYADTDPYGPPAPADTANSPDGGYARLIIRNTGTVSHASITTALCRIDDTGCVNETTGIFTGGIGDSDPTVTPPGDQITYDLSDITPNASYALYIINTSGTLNGFFSIQSFGPTTGQALGLPLFGKMKVDVSAEYTGLTRKYRAIIPIGGRGTTP